MTVKNHLLVNRVATQYCWAGRSKIIKIEIFFAVRHIVAFRRERQTGANRKMWGEGGIKTFEKKKKKKLRAEFSAG